MDCPYLSVTSNGRICRLMEKQGLDGEIDDFDVTHYCRGNPNYCFFFRSHRTRIQVDGQPENKPKELSVPIVPLASIALNESTQSDEPSSKQSDRLFKLKRLLRIA